MMMMIFKKILIAVFIASAVFPIYGASAATLTPEPVKDTVKNTVDAIPSSVENIQNIVKEKTPNFIVKPIIYLRDKIENLRKSFSEKVSERKAKTESEINLKTEQQKTEEEKLQSEENITTNYSPGVVELFKGFKHLELFILILLLFILNTPWLFYLIIVFLIFIIVRFFYFRIY